MRKMKQISKKSLFGNNYTFWDVHEKEIKKYLGVIGKSFVRAILEVYEGR